MITLTHESFLYFLVRVVLGVLFFFQGYDKVFRLKISGVIAYFREETHHKAIPGFALVIAAYFTSYVELGCGALLTVGLLQTPALYFLGLDIILVCAAFSLLKPMWNMDLLFPRLILLSALMCFPTGWDILSIDSFFSGKK